jgi:hypothetical protein
MKPTNPIEIDGQIYDLYTINLAITSVVKPDASEDANVSMRLLPTRIADGEVIVAEDYARVMLLGSVANVDLATKTAVAQISASIQEFIYAKGI